MVGICLTEYAQQQMCNAMKAHVTAGNFSGPYYGASVVLFVNNITPTKNSVLTDLTAPAYTGYAPQAVTWSTPFRRQEGGIGMTGNEVVFQMPDGTHPTPVYGYGIVDAGGTNLLAAERFAAGPQSLTDALSAVPVIPQIAFGGPDFGSAITGN